MNTVKNLQGAFKERVLGVVRTIAEGEMLSYAEVANRAGSPNAFRVVGSIMKANSDLSVPCHRVVRSDGKIGEYNGLRGPSKEELLRSEKM